MWKRKPRRKTKMGGGYKYGRGFYDKILPRVLELAKAGDSYELIANKLNAEKVPTIAGKPWTKSTVSNVLVSGAGYRRRAPENVKYWAANQRSSKSSVGAAPVSGASASGATKWDLLATIERCEDIQPAARKALLELVFKELAR